MKKKLLCILMGVVVTTSCIATSAYASSKTVILDESNITTTVYEKTSTNELNKTGNAEVDNLLEDYVTNENITITVYPKTSDDQTNETYEDADILFDSSKLRGDSAPTTYHDLTISDYNFSTGGNLVSSTYTNRYFNASYKNEISINISGLDSAGKNIEILLYENNNTTPVSTWKGNPADVSGVGFNGLSTSKHYYFQIKADIFTKVKGSGTIHHHYK